MVVFVIREQGNEKRKKYFSGTREHKGNNDENKYLPWEARIYTVEPREIIRTPR